MVEQKAPLRGHLGTVAGAERAGERVERLATLPHLGHVFLVFSFERVTAAEGFRPLLVDDVLEIGGRHGIDDLRHFGGVLAPQPHLHHLRLHRCRHLDRTGEPADRVFVLLADGRQFGDAGPPQGRSEHERRLDQRHLRLAIGLVFAAVTTATGEHARLVAHPQPRDGLVAPWHEEPGGNRCRRGEERAEHHGRQPPPAERMPNPLVVDAARQRIVATTIGRGIGWLLLGGEGRVAHGERAQRRTGCRRRGMGTHIRVRCCGRVAHGFSSGSSAATAVSRD